MFIWGNLSSIKNKFAYSKIKIIQFCCQIYVSAKIISRGYMTYINICVGEGVLVLYFKSPYIWTFKI